MNIDLFRGGKKLNRLVLSVFAIFVISLALFYFYGFPASELILITPTPETSIQKPKDYNSTTQLCRAVCVKDKKDRLMEAKEIGHLRSIPHPECHLCAPNIDIMAYGEWSEGGLCSTICLKDAEGSLTATNETDPNLPYCSILAAPAHGRKFNGTSIEFSGAKQVWTNLENLAERCNDVHSLDRAYYHKLKQNNVHIVFFVWLPKNKNSRAIIPFQLQDMKRSGLLDRPNTFLHFAISCDVEEEWKWFNDLPMVKKYAKTMVRSKKNRYEFTGIRLLWELSCRSLSEGHPNDILLYMHSKGARYGVGRIGTELALTNEIVTNWKLILNLFAAWPAPVALGLGGSLQWINFYWVRASIAKTAPLPVITHSRFWYEEWSSFDLSKEFPSVANTSQCHLATGIDSIAAIADSAFRPKDVKDIPKDSATRTIDNFAPEHLRLYARDPQYSILRCGMVEVSQKAVIYWQNNLRERLNKYLEDQQIWIRNNTKSDQGGPV